MAEPKHNPLVRSCIVITSPPLSQHLLRDDLRCPACDEMHRLMHLDPDVREVLVREALCEACQQGDKPQLSQAEYGDSRSGGSENG